MTNERPVEVRLKEQIADSDAAVICGRDWIDAGLVSEAAATIASLREEIAARDRSCADWQALYVAEAKKLTAAREQLEKAVRHLKAIFKYGPRYGYHSTTGASGQMLTEAGKEAEVWLTAYDASRAGEVGG